MAYHGPIYRHIIYGSALVVPVQTLTFLDFSHLKSSIHTAGKLLYRYGSAEQLQGHRLTASGSGVGATLKVTDTPHKHT